MGCCRWSICKCPVLSFCSGDGSSSAVAPGSSASSTPGLPPASSIATIPLLTSVSSSIAGGASTSLTTVNAGSILPDLSALLADPLMGAMGVVGVGKTEPLIISPSLPPIPGKVVERVKQGKFVDFKEFLADNIMLLQKLQELGLAGTVAPALQPVVSGSRLREVTDPVAWASCFLMFMAAKIDHEETRELAAYGTIVLQLASKHIGGGWRSYDRQFRQQKAAGASLPWADLNPSLMAATVLGQSLGGASRICTICLSGDHLKEDCALASLELAKQGTAPLVQRVQQPSRQARRPVPYTSQPAGTGVCFRYNRGTCFAARCRFEHFCSNCSRQGHPAISCAEPGKSGEREAKSPPPQRLHAGRNR